MAPKFALFTNGSKLPLNKGFKNMYELLQSCAQPSISCKNALYQPSQDLDHPAHLCNLISFSCLSDKALNPWLPTECPVKTDQTAMNVQADQSSLGAHTILYEILRPWLILFLHGNFLGTHLKHLATKEHIMDTH